MKKLLALLLVIVLSLGVLTACGGKDEEALAGAAEYLDGMYKENNGEETPRDYNVVGKIIIDDQTFTVTWTTDSDKISVTESSKAGFWTIDVPEANATAFTYKITAKIANEKGDTVEKTFTKTMPVVTKNPTVGDVKENTAYKFYIYQGALKTPLFATHTIDSGKYYATVDSWDKAPDFYVEAVTGGYKFYTNIDGAKKYVNAYLEDGTSKRLSYTDATDSVWTYNADTLGWITTIDGGNYAIGTYNTFNTFCISDASFLTAESTGKTQFPAGFVPVENKDYIPAPKEAVIYQTPEEIVNAAYALAKDEILSAGHKYTLTGVITKIDTAWSDQYNNITVSIVVGNMTDKPIQCFRLAGDGAQTLKIGDTITASGTIKNYAGKVEMENAKLESVVAAQYSDAEKLAYEKNALTVPTDIKSATTITLPATGATFNTVAITWEATGAAIENGKINVTLGDVAIEFTLKATLTCGTETAVTKEFTVKVAKAPASNPTTYGVVTELKTGDEVLIGAPAYGKLLSALKVNETSYYNKGVDYSATNFANVTDNEIFVVTVNSDGSYTFTSKTGVVIALAADYSSLNADGENKSWTLEAKSGATGIYYVKNAGRGNYLEWYADKDNWSTHNGTLNDLFEISFYAIGGTVTPDQGGDNTGDDNTEITPVQPTVGNKYNAYVNAEALGGVVYLTGKTGDSAWYLATSANAADAAVVYVEAVTGVDGAYYLYFMDGTTKKYIEAYERTPGEAGKGKGSIQIVETTPTSYYTYDATYKTLVVTSADNANKYYIGTYTNTKDNVTYNTLSCSNYSYLSADNVGVTQFPMYFVAVTDDTTGGETGGETGGDNTTDLTTPEAIVDAAYALANNATLEGGPYTLTGVVSEIDGVTANYVTLWIVVAGKTDKPLQCYHLAGTGFDLLKVGDTVTVKGQIKNYYTSYNNTKTIEFDSPSLESYAFAQTTDADKIADAKADIDVVESMFKDGTITLPTTSARHNSVTITWAITEDANSSATLTGAELAIALADTASTLKLTATIASGSASDTLVVEIALAVKPAEGAAETDGRFTEETAYYLTATAADGTVYYFNGTVAGGKGSSTTNKSEAIKVYVEIVDGGYYLYSVSGSVKTYYSIGTKSTTFTSGSDPVLLTWNETYETLQGESGRMFWLYGSANDFRTYSSNNGQDTNKPTSLIVAE